MPGTILYEKENHVVIVTMNRPEARNAMNTVMSGELGKAFADFRDDPDAWILIITGAGDVAFSAGADLKEISERRKAGLPAFDPSRPEVPSIMQGTIDIWKPIIAAINGFAVGGGLEMALACDVRIAAEHARMGLQEPKMGLMAGAGGTVRLQRLIPLGIALELLLTGDLISAQEAYRIGLVNQVVPSAELMPAAHKMAERFLECAPIAVRTIKETALRTLELPLKDALRARFGRDVMITDDATEGSTAFAEKRKPVWKGR